jgi:hypothetical protein
VPELREGVEGRDVQRGGGEVNRYLAFGGDHYYPAGGWNDFRGSAATPDEAAQLASQGWSPGTDYASPFDWWQVIDGETGEQIASNAQPLRTEPGVSSAADSS